MSQVGNASREGVRGFDFWLEHAPWHQIGNEMAHGGRRRGGCLGSLPSPCLAASPGSWRARMWGSSSSPWGEGSGPTELPQLVRGCKCDSPLAVPARGTGSAMGGQGGLLGKQGGSRTDTPRVLGAAPSTQHHIQAGSRSRAGRQQCQPPPCAGITQLCSSWKASGSVSSVARMVLRQRRLTLPKERVCAPGSVRRALGKRFPEDSLAPGWQQCLQDAGGAGRCWRGAPGCRGHPQQGGNDAAPLWRMAQGFSWCTGTGDGLTALPPCAKVGLGDLVPLVKV